jgi:cell wall-associated NlpC family hydrolase
MSSRTQGETVFQGVTGTYQGISPARRRTRWLVRAASVVFLAAFAGLGSVGSASAATGTTKTLLGRQIAAYAKTFVGRYPYTWGGDSPQTGFDCSGLTSYIYQQYGRAIPRTAEGQYLAFRKVPNGKEWRGDLIFFHDSTGHVYHVGIYVGGGNLVAAADPQQGIVSETIWSSAVTFGTLTH